MTRDNMIKALAILGYSGFKNSAPESFLKSVIDQIVRTGVNKNIARKLEALGYPGKIG